MYLCIYVCISIYPSIYLRTCQCVYVSIYLYLSIYIYLYIYLSIYIYISFYPVLCLYLCRWLGCGSTWRPTTVSATSPRSIIDMQYTYIHNVHTSIYICIYIDVYIYACMHASMSIHPFIYMRTC